MILSKWRKIPNGWFTDVSLFENAKHSFLQVFILDDKTRNCNRIEISETLTDLNVMIKENIDLDDNIAKQEVVKILNELFVLVSN